MTITPQHITSLKRIKKEFGDTIAGAAVISTAENVCIAEGIYNYHWD
jgi:hypothetical protein